MDDNTSSDTTTSTGLRPVLRQFGETTSVKGVGRALKSSRPCMRCVWTTAVVFGLTFALYNIILLLVRYFEYQTVFNYDVCTGDCAVEFPDVTVCNLNPLSLSLDDYDWEGDKPWKFDQYQDFVISNYGRPDFQYAIQATLQRKLSDDEFERLMGTYASMPTYFQNFERKDAERLRDVLKKTFLQYHSFYDWEFNVLNATGGAEILPMLSPQYLWCYTMQSPDPIKTRGMQTILYLDNFAYSNMSSFEPDLLRSQAAGVRVVIHPRNTLPDLAGGLNVGPGRQNDVVLKANHIKRLGKPYDKCDSGEGGLRAMEYFRGDASIKYTQKSCLSACQQNDMMARCGCMAAHHAFTRDMWPDGSQNMAFCQKVNITVNSNGLTSADVTSYFPQIVDSINKSLCENEAQADIAACECHESCEETTYTYNQHSIPWPHKGYEMAFYRRFIHNTDLQHYFQDYETMDELLRDRNNSENFQRGRDMLQESRLITENFLQLNIYFEDGSVLETTQQPAITRDTLFGSIGGNLNLWIGITFFTIIELIELCYNFAGMFWKKEHRARTTVAQLTPATVKENKWASSVTHGQKL